MTIVGKSYHSGAFLEVVHNNAYACNELSELLKYMALLKDSSHQDTIWRYSCYSVLCMWYSFFNILGAAHGFFACRAQKPCIITLIPRSFWIIAGLNKVREEDWGLNSICYFKLFCQSETPRYMTQRVEMELVKLFDKSLACQSFFYLVIVPGRASTLVSRSDIMGRQDASLRV